MTADDRGRKNYDHSISSSATGDRTVHNPPSQVFSLSQRKKLVAKLMSPSAQARAMCRMVRYMLNRKAPAGKKATPWGEIAHLMIAVSHRKVIRG